MKNVNMTNPKIKNILRSSWKIYTNNTLYLLNIGLLFFIIKGIIVTIIFSMFKSIQPVGVPIEEHLINMIETNFICFVFVRRGVRPGCIIKNAAWRNDF